MTIGPPVDEIRVAAARVELQRKQQHVGQYLIQTFLRYLLLGVVLFFGVFPLLDGRLPGPSDFTGRWPLIRAFGALLTAAAFTGLSYRGLRVTLRATLSEHRQLLQAEYDRWTGPDWRRRTLGLGALLTAGVGLPVGLLVSLTFPATDLPGGSRPLLLIVFVGLTAACVARPDSFERPRVLPLTP